MKIVCLDLEGVLVPEIWIAFARESGIPALERTTREEPDYEKLMRWRMELLRGRGLGLREIRDVIARIEPLPGARAFLDELRSFAQVLIVSDTFDRFAAPLMEKLGRPTIFCNTLRIDEEGYLCGMQMRCAQSKLTTVRALQAIGFETVAAGDSYNDIDMLCASEPGVLFRAPEHIRAEYPQLPACDGYDELLALIRGAYE